MRELSTVFVVATIGLAAATGTLGALAAAGAFSLATYAVMAKGGRARIEREVLAELQYEERAVALLDRFLAAGAPAGKPVDGKPADKKKGDNPWDDPRDIALLKSMFPHAMAGRSRPDWGTLQVLRQRATRRVEEFKAAVTSRVPKNDFAARAAGLGTFLCPPIGIAAIGYTVLANRAQRLAAAAEAKLAREEAERREAEARTAKAIALVGDRRRKKAKAVRAKKAAEAAELVAAERAASEEYEDSLLAHGAAVPSAPSGLPPGFQPANMADAMP